MSVTEPGDSTVSETCYRHPDRESGVSCQRCDRKICSQCMHQASVGVHCPECVSGGQQRVYTPRTLPGARGVVTRALVGVNVALWVLSIAALDANTQNAGQVFVDYGTFGRAIDLQGEWWRLISGGFLHSGLIHIGFNMYLLWQLGQMLERSLGEVRFSALYFVSLLGGSFGAVLLQPNSPAVGASGAVFGLIGAMVLLHRRGGVGLFDTGLGFLILINGLLSLRAGVSLGGHLGGFLVGLVIGVLFFGYSHGGRPPIRDPRIQLGLTIGLGVVLFAGGIWAATTWQDPLF